MLSLVTIVALASVLTLPACDNPVQCPTPSVSAGGNTITARDQLNTRTEKNKQKKEKEDAKAGTPTPPAPPKKLVETTLPTPKTKGPHCGANTDICDPPAKTKTTPRTDPAPTSTQLREVVAKLKLPDPTPRLGPDPSVNEWNMLAVGYPIWLWTDQPTHLTTTAHHDGLTFTLDAQQTSTTFNMGDHNTKTCTATTPYTTYTPKPSPTCGYTYEDASPVGHPYTLTATTTWTITWQATGHHGTLTHTTTGTRTLDVGELQSLIIG